jgi:hypothetical protein
MAGILKLPEELRLEILGWLAADHDALFSLYSTSTTFRASLVSYLLERVPQLLISWAAETGASKLIERVVARYPEATINRSSTIKLYGICSEHALVIAAGNGHAKVVEIILTLDTIHLEGHALCEAAKDGHADAVSAILRKFLGHQSPGFHDALSDAIRRGHIKVMKVFREYGDPARHHCSKNLNLTARKGKKGKKGGKGGKGNRGNREEFLPSIGLLNRTWTRTLVRKHDFVLFNYPVSAAIWHSFIRKCITMTGMDSLILTVNKLADM